MESKERMSGLLDRAIEALEGVLETDTSTLAGKIRRLEKSTEGAIEGLCEVANSREMSKEMRLATLRDRLASGELARLKTIEQVEFGQACISTADRVLSKIRELISEVETQTTESTETH